MAFIEGDLALFISPSGKKSFTRLAAGGSLTTHEGCVPHEKIIGQPKGITVVSSTGHRFAICEPSIEEVIKKIRRNSQIIYPEDAGRILFKLNIAPGIRVIEAGTGSGALTIALSRFVGTEGHVFSYEAREDMLRNALINLKRAACPENITVKRRHISEGFDETGVDALFLDVREPWEYLPQVIQALRPGGFFGAILPTTNQIRDLLLGFQTHGFIAPEVEENLHRRYKAIPDRLRPDDVMVGHTGFLVFARAPTVADESETASGLEHPEEHHQSTSHSEQ